MGAAKRSKLEVALFLYPPRQDGECILWTGSRNKCGYGTYAGKLAHRLVWQHKHGDIPPGMVLMHSCDTPACINSAHLSVGTQQENIADMLAKGRGKNWRNKRGANNPAARLTADEVWAIRWLMLPSKRFSRKEIARSFGVSTTPIHFIASGRSWPHITRNWPFEELAA